jgi:hypothetical protein
MKVVINACHGGFSLSHEAIVRYAEIKGLNLQFKESAYRTILCYEYFANNDYFSCCNIPRNDPALVAVVEEMGETANDRYSDLKVIEIPDDVQWYIDEYDGREWVSEVHRKWS